MSTLLNVLQHMKLTKKVHLMDIHRCRFVPYPPSAINALAFTHTSLANKSEQSPGDLRLAIGRTNGDIEIWNPFGGQWFQETIFRGAKDRSIENLAWTQDWDVVDDEIVKPGRLRLFSIGNSTSVTEWDLSLGAPARHANGNSGDLWCLAAQPRWMPRHREDTEKLQSNPHLATQYLAAGCSDGSIVLFTTEDGDLRFAKIIGKPPSKKPHVLSISWRDRNTLIVGYDDSTIRVYDIRSRTTIRNMSLGKPGTGKSDIHVWAVRCLPNGGIVSGDSTGQLKIWDANNYSLVQSIQAHKADILDIVTSADGRVIITGGADQRTVAYGLSELRKGQNGQRWAQLTHRRFHQHDVRAMAAFESKDLSVVVSGGLDTVPIVMPLREIRTQYHRSLSNLPQRPQLCSSTESRLMLSWWDRDILIWRFSRPRTAEQDLDDRVLGNEIHQMTARLFLKGDENITSAFLSDDGKLIAVATVAGVKLFQLRQKKVQGSVRYRTRQIELPTTITQSGAKSIIISPDNRWLAALRLNNVLVMAKIIHRSSPSERPRLLNQTIKLARSAKTSSQNIQNSGLDTYLGTINNITFSKDSRVLAVSDLSGRIDTWLLEGYEDATEQMNAENTTDSRRLDRISSAGESSDDDSDEDDPAVVQGQRWIRNPAGSPLPRLDSAISVLSFRPRKELGSSPLINGNVRLHATRHNPHPHSHDLPSGDLQLIAVTASKQLTEFEVLHGRLSEWSRRNPAAYFPSTFKVIKDPAMGCFWDLGISYARLWLYGATWIFMLDLSQNLPDPQVVGKIGGYDVLSPTGNIQKKRKRLGGDDHIVVKRNTGAGDTIQGPDTSTGTGQNSLKYSGENPQLIDMQEEDQATSDDEDGSQQGNSALAVLRRNDEATTGHSRDGGGPAVVNGTNGTDKSSVATKANQEPPRGVWHTFAYRSILGIVPIAEDGSETNGAGDEYQGSRGNLEVAIVERPIDELGLPPRFDGGQDWET